MARPSAREMTPDEVDRLAARPTDSRVFRAEVLDRLRRSVGFDSFAWILTDPVTTVGVDPFAQLPDLRALPTVVRLKYLTDLNRWTSLTDASSLGDRAEESRLWREVQRQHGVADVASVVFKDRFGCWGFLDLWSSRTFTAAEVDLLRRLTPHLTTALRQRQAATFAVVAPDRSQAGPAVLLLRHDLGIAGQTGAAEAWMSVMLPPSSGVPPIPAAAYNVAAQLLAREHGVDDHEPMARTHLADGLWATVRASRVEPGELIAVSVEATGPADRLDVFARAVGLSARERELVTLLAQGADTAEAAARMSVSPHTLQDHLKSVFAKTGTRTRRVLLSHALGVRPLTE